MKGKLEKLNRRKISIRKKLGRAGYRLSLSRSNQYFFAQIIDLGTGKTVFGLSSKNFMQGKEKMSGVENAQAFGEKFAKEAVAKKISKVVFDRGGCLYHGRVKAFAEGARKGGLVF